ncbi:MAG: DNA-binding response regulator [Chloroflexi bacterium HGW-Chloroflexi-4]|jgi:two-component system alkaline phosphatase synthesis response regulator PhoP|nr:MAG: DNA-binding response regulator [Chloroflexi bacterium HGW-Chloroflexi-4]
MATPKILIIDDEPSIHTVITAYLKAEGYDYLSAMDGQTGLQTARTFKPDVIILDVMLPGMDGVEVLTNLRRESNAYVIMLTARAEETDKIVGLSVGADDYLTKPFSPRELIARIKAVLRRLQNTRNLGDSNSSFVFSHIHIDSSARRVWVDEQLIDLTAVEFDLLVALAQHQGMVLTREQLLEKAWGYDYFGDTRVVDVHIGHVRQKLGEDRFIETIRGVGYRFEDK